MTKSLDKNFGIFRTKRAFKLRQKAFFIIFKGISIKQIKQMFLEGETPTLGRINLAKSFLKFLFDTFDTVFMGILILFTQQFTGFVSF